jgi:hypothetical protein
MTDDWMLRDPETENPESASDSGTNVAPDVPPTTSGRYDDLDELLRSYTPSRPVQTASARERRARKRMEARRVHTMASRRPAEPGGAAKGGRNRFIDALTSLQLPRIPINRAGLYLIGSAAFVIAVVFVLGRIRNNPEQATPNAIWIGTEWTHAERSQDEVNRLAARLREHQIGSVYAWVSWLQADNTWRSVDQFDRVRTFVQQFRTAYPNAVLMGWIGVPAEAPQIPYRLDNPTVQTQIVDFSERLINDFGFDGVFVNIEPVWNEDDHFLAILRQIRARLGADTRIAVAAPPDWTPIGVGIPVPPNVIPGTIWSVEFKQSTALLVDEIAIMAYNSGLSAAEDYSAWVAYQVQAFASAVAGLGVLTDIVVGIPTYDAEPPGHDPLVENIQSAARGIRAGMETLGEDAVYVRGTALYAEWTTDEVEWLDYLRSWVAAQ